MSSILDKRNDLERFIREQTLGPGINRYRFADLTDRPLVEKDIRTLEPLSYEEEIIDIVPAAVYSTGILFPEDKTGTNVHEVVNDANEEESEEEEGDEEVKPDVMDDLENTDTVELNQMFPKVMGFTCCLDEEILQHKQIAINLQARYYRKIDKKQPGYHERYGLLCETDPVIFQDYLVKNNLLSYFTLKQAGPNHFILLHSLKDKELIGIKTQIGEIKNKLFNALKEKIRGKYSFKNAGTISNINGLKITIYKELKNNVTDPQERAELYEISQQIEQEENISDHLINLIDTSLSKGYGLWKAEKISRQIRIDNISFPENKRKISWLYNGKTDENITIWDNRTNQPLSQGAKNIFICNLQKEKDGKEEQASLSVNIQLSRDTRNKKGQIFLKVQLLNTSTPFQDADAGSRYYSTFNEVVNQRSFFGVKLSLTSPYLLPYNRFDREYDETADNYDEDITTKFIYSQFRDYGIGHSCSVKWDAAASTVETEYIPTCETPDVDPTPRNKKGPVVKDEDLFKDPLFLPDDSKAQQFKWLSTLSDASDKDILNALNEFVNAYGEWIDIKCAEYNAGHSYGKIAGQELEKCRTDFERMKNNISELLSGTKNSGNLLCFRLMNTAMFMQLWHGIKNKNGKVKDSLGKEFTCFDQDFYKEHADDKLFPPYSQPASWRAFQLAFILLNLDGMFQPESDPAWEKRNKWVDLVWFPTGGGKTEAYLGLIALTILNRRRTQGEKGGGTAAIMRYTLRLLTMQQFQRATLMIMALELIRRWELYELGKEPIYIGFWVGNSSIPNKLTSTNWRDLNKEDDSLRAEFRKLQEGKENKIPFHVCPWCGDNLNPIPDRGKGDTYNIDRLNLHCHNTKCAFVQNTGWEKHKYRGPIPVNLCDASIYQHPPTLLFGTVDKFAQLAHKVSDDFPNADSRRLFGKGKWEAGKPPAGYLPPDLIIQDELHLLLGPLGSAVALFEAAIDQLCVRKDGTRPKIISSTATTRNTELQIAAVFDRKVDLFPKPGVECDDSFYAYYKRKHSDEDRSKTAYISKRKYMGLLPTGRTQIWMQMRLEAILLTHRALWELKELGTGTPIQYEQYKTFEKVMDYYHTTLSYFNSLKEVGKTQSQIQSYILKETRRVFTRVIRPQKLMHALYTYGPLVEGELTGRLNGEEVKLELKSVQKKWTAENRFAVREGDKTIIGDVPPELVVATNMISVGIDVSRFNTILMNSMPRNTAEYIQASSRVARDNYGLVLTVHHPFRARDVSHYEHFIEFHEKMYSYVEPISITPFTGKAVDRYMGLYLATIIRHTENNLGDRKNARNILNYSRKNLPRLTEKLLQYFTKRQERLKEFPPAIQNILREKDIKYIHRWIDEALAEWHQKATDTNKEKKEFVYNNNKAQGQEQLFIDIDEYEGNIDSKKWQIPQSLRVIEPQAAIHIHSK